MSAKRQQPIDPDEVFDAVECLRGLPIEKVDHIELTRKEFIKIKKALRCEETSDDGFIKQYQRKAGIGQEETYTKRDLYFQNLPLTGHGND